LAGRPELVDLELRRMARRGGCERAQALVLDAPELDGARLRRVRVIAREELSALLSRLPAAEVIIVPPAAPGFASAIQRTCEKAGRPCRSASSLLSLNQLLTSSESLLARAPVSSSSSEELREVVTGRRVLVTGAGGSIGSQLAREVKELAPKTLTLIDRSENALFHIERDLGRRRPGCEVHAHVVDVRDAAAVQRVFASSRPEVVFHAAAHKHVPMMERHPAEAVVNNVIGTRLVAEAADGIGVRTFVFISSDKAVRPSSVMGATKRVGEHYIRWMGQRSKTRFSVVRFGNVLGSSGSVLPIFIEQIQQGGPVTVTHPAMERFFMSIPEASRLVLSAAALAEREELGGGLFVLDMGQPVRIVELARSLIERAGLQPDEDVAIEFSGARPGEKLAEELTLADEQLAPTSVPGVRLVAGAPVSALFPGELERLEEAARAGDNHTVLGWLAHLAEGYRPAGWEEPAEPAPLVVEECNG
jgi:FlaA1/EpsC-like NDP-sugar epimerase